MKKHNKYSLLGLQALQRAADKVAEEAIKNNYKIPIWKNGKVVFEIPKKTRIHKWSPMDTNYEKE